MDNRKIYDQLREVEMALRSAYNRFEQISEPDLVESEIFMIKCLEAKRNHLIKEARIADAAEAVSAAEESPKPNNVNVEIKTKASEKITT